MCMSVNICKPCNTRNLAYQFTFHLAYVNFLQTHKDKKKKNHNMLPKQHSLQSVDSRNLNLKKNIVNIV